MTVDNTHTYFANGSAVRNKIADGGYCIFDLWGWEAGFSSHSVGGAIFPRRNRF